MTPAERDLLLATARAIAGLLHHQPVAYFRDNWSATAVSGADGAKMLISLIDAVKAEHKP